MDKRIEIEVVNTTKDYWRVLLWLYKKKLILIGIVYAVVAVPMFWLMVFGAGANPFNDKNRAIVLTASIFVVLPLIITGSILYNIRKQSNEIAKTLEPSQFIFSDAGIESISKSTKVEKSWDSIQKVHEIKDDFLFYLQKNIFYTIPKRSFQNDSQTKEFKNLVREKLGNRAQLNKL